MAIDIFLPVAYLIKDVLKGSGKYYTEVEILY